MKLLTLNTHSWLEDQPLLKIEQLATKIAAENYDVIALQEVNQLRVADNATQSIQPDNYGLLLVTALQNKGINYDYRWVSVHQAYKKFDEGIALLSLRPIEATDELILSPLHFQYEHYQRRKALGIKLTINQHICWFYSVHFSWWQSDTTLGFQYEWLTLANHLRQHPIDSLVFLMGDFNNPAHVRNQGYELIESTNWHDTFYSAKQTTGIATVNKGIAGWEDNHQGIRIDYIFTSKPIPVLSSAVCFNGDKGPIVSDHFGIEITLPTMPSSP